MIKDSSSVGISRLWRGAGFLLAIAAASLLWYGLTSTPSIAGDKTAPVDPQAESHADPSNDSHVVTADGNAISAGRYLVMIGGCNDCHTPGWDRAPGKIPESQWLTGVPLGWRGPWGTSYAPNLRLTVQKLNEDVWVELLHKRKARPPMPWSSVNAMSTADVRAIYQYIKSLGPAGQLMPNDLPPDREPKGPYLNLMPVMPKER